jgi:hypothetical protein
MNKELFSEVKVSIKDSDQKLVRHYPVYSEGFSINREDETLKKMVEDTLKDFAGDQADCDITVNVKYTW